MKYISLGIIDKKFLIPIIGGILALMYSIFIGYSPKIAIIDDNPFLQTLYIDLGMVFALIPYLITKYKSKRENKKYNEQLIKSELYNKLKDSKDVIKKTKYKKYRFIIYSAILNFLQDLLLTLLAINFIYNY